MDTRKIAKTTFIINLIALLATISMTCLLIFQDIQLTLKPFKIFLFLALNMSTIFGLYTSITNKIKPLTTYYIILIFSPIILTIGSVMTGNGIIPLHFAGQMISATFDGDEKIIEKNNLAIKRRSSFFSNQWYDIVESKGVFEKKIGHFNAGEFGDFTDFKMFDSMNKKYIKLTDSKQTKQTEEVIN